MKKLFFILISFFLLTACGANRIAIAPSGVPQLLNPATPQNDDLYHYSIDETPLQNPIAIPMPTDTDGVLRLSMRHPLTLNPLLNQDVTVARILRLIYEPLITLDENFRPTSNLAEIEFASDYSGVSLTIRSDAFWSDGMPVTSDDLIFSIEALRGASPNAIYYRNVQNIAEVTRINSRAVHIHFHKMTLHAAYDLNFPIIPRHHTSDNLPGNGSFMPTNSTGSLTLTHNPYSFRPRPQVDTIEVLFLPDAQTDLYAFDQGRIDALHLSLTDWAQHRGLRHIRHEIFPAMYFEFIGFNFQREIFENVQIRRGIAHAFDADTAIHDIYLTHAVRASSPIHPYSWAASSVAGLAYNPVAAYNLLAVIQSEELTIIANDCNPQRTAIAKRLAESLTGAGLPTQTELLPLAEYFARIDLGDFDLYIGGVNLAFAPHVQLFFEGSKLFPADYALQDAFYAVRLAGTEMAYLQAMAEFQLLFAEQLPVISLAFRHSAVLTNMRITQNVAPIPDNVFGGLGAWVID